MLNNANGADFQRILDLKWPEGAFRSTFLIRISFVTERSSPRVALLVLNKDMFILQQLEREFPGLADARSALQKGRTVILQVSPSIQVLGEEAAASSDRILAVRYLPAHTGENPEEATEAYAEAITDLPEQVATNPVFTSPVVLMISAAIKVKNTRKALETRLLGSADCHIKLCIKGHTEKKRQGGKREENLASVLVNPGQLSYADAVNRLQSSVDPSEQDVRVKRITKAATGQTRRLPPRSRMPSKRRLRWRPTPGLLVGGWLSLSGTSPKIHHQRLYARCWNFRRSTGSAGCFVVWLDVLARSEDT